MYISTVCKICNLQGQSGFFLSTWTKNKTANTCQYWFTDCFLSIINFKTFKECACQEDPPHPTPLLGIPLTGSCPDHCNSPCWSFHPELIQYIGMGSHCSNWGQRDIWGHLDRAMIRNMLSQQIVVCHNMQWTTECAIEHLLRLLSK